MSASMKILEFESCCVCGTRGSSLQHVESLDAELPLGETTLQTKLSTIADDKIVAGHICVACVQRANDAWSFQQQLRASQSQPSLSDKIRLLRQRLRELTQKIDVFIVIGPEKDDGQPVYSEDNIIMVDKNMLGDAEECEYETVTNEAGVKVYQCTVCPKLFTQLSEMMDHSHSHPADAAHTCWTCGKQYRGKDLYRAHSKVHRSIDDFVCKLCNTIFQGLSEMKNHACKSGCPSCGETFPSRASLAEHARARHNALGAPPHVCHVCMETFERPEQLIAHADKHIKTPSFRCGYEGCVMKYLTKASLMLHVRKAHALSLLNASATNNPEANECSVCQITCESQAALRKHLRTHEVKPKRGRPKKVKLEYVKFVETPTEDAQGDRAPKEQDLEQLEYDDQTSVFIQQELQEGEYELECVEGGEVQLEMLDEQTEQVEYLEVETLEDDLEEEKVEMIL